MFKALRKFADAVLRYQNDTLNYQALIHSELSAQTTALSDLTKVIAELSESTAYLARVEDLKIRSVIHQDHADILRKGN